LVDAQNGVRWQEKPVGSYENNIKTDVETLNVGMLMDLAASDRNQ